MTGEATIREAVSMLGIVAMFSFVVGGAEGVAVVVVVVVVEEEESDEDKHCDLEKCRHIVSDKDDDS